MQVGVDVKCMHTNFGGKYFLVNCGVIFLVNYDCGAIFSSKNGIE